MSQIRRYLIFLYCFIFVLYNLKDILYPSGTISQSILLIFFFIGFLSIFVELSNKRVSFCSILWFLFLIMNLIYYVLSPKEIVGLRYEAVGIATTTSQTAAISTFCISYFMGKVYSNVHFPTKLVVYFCYSMYVIAILNFMLKVSQFESLQSTATGFTINASYMFACLIPYIPIVSKKNKYLSIIMIFVSTYFILYSAKRGAILCWAVSFVLSLIYYLFKQKVSTIKILLLFIFMIVLLFFAYDMYNSNAYLNERVSNTESRGMGMRSIGYAVLWEHWISSQSIKNFLLGEGTMQTVSIWGNLAHNDWLELLIDNGLMGASLYLLLFVVGFKIVFPLDMDWRTKLTTYLCFAIWLTISFFSMGYTSMDTPLISFLLGLIIGCYRKRVFLQNTQNNKIDKSKIIL